MSQMSQLGQGLGAFSQGLAAMSRNNIQKEQQAQRELERQQAAAAKQQAEHQKYIDGKDKMAAENSADILANNFEARLETELGLYELDNEKFLKLYSESMALDPDGEYSQAYIDAHIKKSGDRVGPIHKKWLDGKKKRHVEQEKILALESLHNAWETALNSPAATKHGRVVSAQAGVRDALQKFIDDPGNGIDRSVGNQIAVRFAQAIAEQTGDPDLITNGPFHILNGIATTGGKTLADSGITKEALLATQQRLRKSGVQAKYTQELADSEALRRVEHAVMNGTTEDIANLYGKPLWMRDADGKEYHLDFAKAKKAYVEHVYNSSLQNDDVDEVLATSEVMLKLGIDKFQPFTDMLRISPETARTDPASAEAGVEFFERLYAVSPALAKANTKNASMMGGNEVLDFYESIRYEMSHARVPVTQAIATANAARQARVEGKEAIVTSKDVRDAIDLTVRHSIFPDFVPEWMVESFNASTYVDPALMALKRFTRTEWETARNPDEFVPALQNMAATRMLGGGIPKDLAIEQVVTDMEDSWVLLDGWATPKSHQVQLIAERLPEIREAYLKKYPEMKEHPFTFRPHKNGQLYEVILDDGRNINTPHVLGLDSNPQSMFDFSDLVRLADDVINERVIKERKRRNKLMKGDGGFIEQYLFDMGQGVQTLTDSKYLGEVVTMNSQETGGFTDTQDVIRVWRKSNPSFRKYTKFEDYVNALRRGEKPQPEFTPIGGPLEGQGPQMFWDEFKRGGD